jgi:hypothetical protein
MKFHALWLSMGWLLVALIVYTSLSPSPSGLVLFEEADTVLQGLAYLVLMVWFGQLNGAGQRPRIALSLTGLGVTLEFFQYLSGVRTGAWEDGLTDVLGIVGGWLLLKTPLGTSLERLDQSLRRATNA